MSVDAHGIPSSLSREGRERSGGPMLDIQQNRLGRSLGDAWNGSMKDADIEGLRSDFQEMMQGQPSWEAATPSSNKEASGELGADLSDDETKTDEAMEMQGVCDFADDPDERNENPTLYLTKFWRLVSPQAPIYHCFRNPQVRKYSCTLTLHLPPRGTRTYKATALYESKRAAKRAVSIHAMQTGILDEAKQAMLAFDRAGTSAAPKFSRAELPRPEERYDEAEQLSQREFQAAASVENPITLLNLAVQKYCTEGPTHALNFEQEAVTSNRSAVQLYHCGLDIRITPELIETFRSPQPEVSIRAAREGAARAALQSGVVQRMKISNSITSKVCRQLGIAAPQDVNAHDTVDEENTAGALGQLVQEVTRKSESMTCEYTKSPGIDGELVGAKLCITLKPGNTLYFEIDPTFKAKKAAKEAVCRLAIKSGIRQVLEAQKRLLDASAALTANLDLEKGISRTTDLPSIPKLGSVKPGEAVLLTNPVGYLNTCMQECFGKPEALQYDYAENGPRFISGHAIGPVFGCTLTVALGVNKVRKYTVEANFPSKKSAKEAVARAAIQQGLLDFVLDVKNGKAFAESPQSSELNSGQGDSDIRHVRIRPSGYPDVQSEDILANAMESDVQAEITAPYTTASNNRMSAIPIEQSQEHKTTIVSPPPYSASSTRASLMPVGELGLSGNVHRNPLVDAQEYMKPQTGQTPLSNITEAIDPFVAARSIKIDQPLVKCIEDCGERLRPNDWRQYVRYDIEYDPFSKRYTGNLTLAIEGQTPLHYSVKGMSTKRNAEEAVATRAIDEGIIAVMENAWRPPYKADENGPTTAPPTDEFPQPVSYLHQACQILLGVESCHRPVYELLTTERGSEYGGRVTIPIDPPVAYEVDIQYRSKALAKEAVTRKAFEDGIIEQLKDNYIICRAPTSALAQEIYDRRRLNSKKETDSTVTKDNAAIATPGLRPQEHGTYIDKLIDYCGTSGRGLPIFTEGFAPDPESLPNQETVKIGNLTFHLDLGRAKRINNASPEALRELLAKKVLKHLLREDKVFK